MVTRHFNRHTLAKFFKKMVFGSCAVMLALSSTELTYADETCAYEWCDCDMNGFRFYGDFIYWQINPEGTEFARQGGFTATRETNLPESDYGRILSANCEFCPGFRIGLNYDLELSNWDAFAQYTFLVGRLEKQIQNDAGNSDIHPLLDQFGGFGSVNFAKGDWSSDLNVLDFGFGRTFDVLCCYSFRPHFGFKATWQNQRYNVSYERIINTNGDRMSETLHFLSHFNGIGLRGGFDTSFEIAPCVSFVGNCAVSSLYSNHHSAYSERSWISKANEPVLIPVIEMMAGVAYTRKIDRCYDAFAMLGYETQVWFGASRFIFHRHHQEGGVIDTRLSKGNLTFHGLVARAGFNY